MQNTNFILIIFCLILRTAAGQNTHADWAVVADVPPVSKTLPPAATRTDAPGGAVLDSTSAVQYMAAGVRYHNGPLLTGDKPTSPLKVHLIWYGNFTTRQRAVIEDLFSSLHGPAKPHTAARWWNFLYVFYHQHRANGTLPSYVQLGVQVNDTRCSYGKSLRRADVNAVVLSALRQKKLPWPGTSARNRLYVVLTAADVTVEDFCMSSCGFHDYTFPTRASKYRMLPYAWVGNAGLQCPGQCAWPYAVPEYGPPGPPLRAPSGDVGADGMVINLGAVLAGAATNPFGTGYYQGDPAAPLEAATACSGSFGPGAYPGYPGKLLVQRRTRASFNVFGANGRQFLLPGLWNPRTSTCFTP